MTECKVPPGSGIDRVGIVYTLVQWLFFAKDSCQKLVLYKLSDVKAYRYWGNARFTIEEKVDLVCDITLTYLILCQFSFNMLGTHAILVLKLKISPKKNVLKLFI